ncbi:MAG: hypothetical protein IJ664_01805 [Clostridia bacterium]|nr:hypothetical protein [Clostridia bacterium]
MLLAEPGTFIMAYYNVKDGVKKGKFLVYASTSIRCQGLIVLKNIDFNKYSNNMYVHLSTGEYVNVSRLYDLDNADTLEITIPIDEFKCIKKKASIIKSPFSYDRVMRNQYTVKRENPDKIRKVILGGKTSPK